jgi:hypothetical protein
MSEKKINESIFEEAQRIIYGPRNESYGPPSEDFAKTGIMWWAILKDLGITAPIPPERVALMMVALKISREVYKHKRDNLTDMCGYTGTKMMIEDEKKKQKEKQDG